MTLEDDHWSAMTHLPHQLRSRDRELDALGDGGSAFSHDLQEVEAFLTQLRGLVDRPAPPPSAELASVLARGFAPRGPATLAKLARPTNRESPRSALSSWGRRGALAFGLTAGLSASLVGAASASGQLPDGARAVVDRIVEAVTPFDIGDGSSQEPLPTVDGSPAPVPSPPAGETGHDTGPVPSFGNDSPVADGVNGRGSGETSGPRTEHDRDSATETDAEPPESPGREDRSGRSGTDGDDADQDDADQDDADQDDADQEDTDDPDDGDAEHSEDGNGEKSGDGEESGAQLDQDD